MGWLEAKKRYETGETLTAQKVEDLVARRVLRGLGLVERQLAEVERALFADAALDEAAWPRTLAILKVALRRKRLEFDIECYDTDPRHKAILDRFAGFDVAVASRPIVFMTRLKGSKESWTYFPVDVDNAPGKSHQLSLYTIKPPFRALQCALDDSHHWICCQETEQFITQFGPYDFKMGES